MAAVRIEVRVVSGCGEGEYSHNSRRSLLIVCASCSIDGRTPDDQIVRKIELGARHPAWEPSTSSWTSRLRCALCFVDGCKRPQTLLDIVRDLKRSGECVGIEGRTHSLGRPGSGHSVSSALDSDSSSMTTRATRHQTIGMAMESLYAKKREATMSRCPLAWHSSSATSSALQVVRLPSQARFHFLRAAWTLDDGW